MISYIGLRILGEIIIIESIIVLVGGFIGLALLPFDVEFKGLQSFLFSIITSILNGFIFLLTIGIFHLFAAKAIKEREHWGKVIGIIFVIIILPILSSIFIFYPYIFVRTLIGLQICLGILVLFGLFSKKHINKWFKLQEKDLEERKPINKMPKLILISNIFLRIWGITLIFIGVISTLMSIWGFVKSPELFKYNDTIKLIKPVILTFIIFLGSGMLLLFAANAIKKRKHWGRISGIIFGIIILVVSLSEALLAIKFYFGLFYVLILNLIFILFQISVSFLILKGLFSKKHINKWFKYAEIA